MADQAPKHRVLIFGGQGAIGNAIAEGALARGWEVVITSRGSLNEKHPDLLASPRAEFITVDPLAVGTSVSSLANKGPYSAVCWAQGRNTNDSIYTVDVEQNLDLYKANCVFILATLSLLLRHKLLISPARLCIISSIWQMIARQNKLSYCMTKAALQGLILSASTDLAEDGHLINGVLPGALETPMTRANLSLNQIAKMESATKFGRLATLHDVVSIVLYLCSPENTGITGQFVAADLGFSHVHLL